MRSFCASVIFGLDHKNQFKSQQWKVPLSASEIAVIENLHLRTAYSAVMDFHCVIQSGKRSPLALRVPTPSEQPLKRGFRQHYFTRNKCGSSTELMSLQQMEHSCLSRAASCSGDITFDSSRGIHSVDILLMMIMIHVAAIKEQFLSTSGTKRVT